MSEDLLAKLNKEQLLELAEEKEVSTVKSWPTKKLIKALALKLSKKEIQEWMAVEFEEEVKEKTVVERKIRKSGIRVRRTEETQEEVTVSRMEMVDELMQTHPVPEPILKYVASRYRASIPKGG